MEALNKYLELAKEKIIKISNNKQLMAKILVILIILFLAAVVKINDRNKNEISIDSNETKQEEVISEICVDISGEVKNPGVYSAKEGTRLYEIIELAGGLTDEADTNNINQAKYVEDGEKIIIPSINAGNTSNTDPGVSNNGLININTANKDKLMELPGVGEAIAQRIIEYRSTTQFKSIEDIMCVNGIGTVTFEKMKDKITI